MTTRINYFQFLSQEIEQLNQIEHEIERYTLDSKLIELVKLRVSQINGCSFCVSYHTQRLRLMGESDERIDMLTVWNEAACYSAAEQAAFRWSEAVTRLADSTGIDDTLYAATVDTLGEQGLSQLTLAVAMINTWNRLAVSFQTDHKFVAELLKSVQPTPA